MSRQPVNPAKIQRVVVRGTNWVGDAVITVPALRSLRELLPEAHITLATRSFAKGIFAGADFIDELLVCEGSLLAQAREWHRRRCDLALLFQNAFAPALIAKLAGVPLRIGYATQGRGWLLTRAVEPPDWRASRHECFYYLNLVSELARLFDREPSNILEQAPVFDLAVSRERKEQAAATLQGEGIRSDRPLIALCPGSINSRAKRWPVERYAALGDRFVDELQAEVILIGSAAELEVSLAVQTRMTHLPKVLTGKTDLAQVVAVLSLVDLLVTNDTGPAHVASALNRPTLVIFGPTNPLTTRPYSTAAEILRQPPDCAPCMLRDCPIDHRCMTAISPDQVFERAIAMLKPSPVSNKLQFVAAPEGRTEANDKLKFVGHVQ